MKRRIIKVLAIVNVLVAFVRARIPYVDAQEHFGVILEMNYKSQLEHGISSFPTPKFESVYSSLHLMGSCGIYFMFSLITGFIIIATTSYVLGTGFKVWVK